MCSRDRRGEGWAWPGGLVGRCVGICWMEDDWAGWAGKGQGRCISCMPSLLDLVDDPGSHPAACAPHTHTLLPPWLTLCYLCPPPLPLPPRFVLGGDSSSWERTLIMPHYSAKGMPVISLDQVRAKAGLGLVQPYMGSAGLVHNPT